MSPIIDCIWNLIKIAYENAPLSIRFAYTYWVLLTFLYVFIGAYERIHNLTPKRKVKKINMPYSVYIPGAISFLAYNIGIITNHKALLNIDDFKGIFTVVGFSFLTLGLIIATWGRITLNGFWGQHIYEYNDKSSLVTFCAYKYLRHPIYTGQIAMAIGSFIISYSWWVIIFPILVIPLNILRASHEEKELQTQFKDEYQNYCNRTLAFFPWPPPK